MLNPLVAVREPDLPEDAYDVFVQYTKVTFWFHSGAARAALTNELEDDCVLLPREAMTDQGIKIDDRTFGDAYLYARAGVSFFLNDFYQPLANAVLVFTTRDQSQRFRQPWHRGGHGYLPQNASELGFLVVTEDGWRTVTTQDEVAITDVAPSLLNLGDAPRTATMPGRDVFRPVTA